LDYSQISLLIDAGLVVLIWMVQLIVYPSFKYYEPKNLLIWHQKYTDRLAVIVIPLMLSQLVFAIFNAFNLATFTSIFTLSIVLFLWIFTFLGFVPLHSKISDGNANQRILNLLIQRNWIRTFLWTALLLFHVFATL